MDPGLVQYRWGADAIDMRNTDRQRVQSYDLAENSSPMAVFSATFMSNMRTAMLIQQTGEADGWGGRPFWWTIVVASSQVNMTMYASKLPSERIKKVDVTGDEEL